MCWIPSVERRDNDIVLTGKKTVLRGEVEVGRAVHEDEVILVFYGGKSLLEKELGLGVLETEPLGQPEI
jgi:hypothetical protein